MFDDWTAESLPGWFTLIARYWFVAAVVAEAEIAAPGTAGTAVIGVPNVVDTWYPTVRSAQVEPSAESWTLIAEDAAKAKLTKKVTPPKSPLALFTWTAVLFPEVNARCLT
jgi:hypothetical protein